MSVCIPRIHSHAAQRALPWFAAVVLALILVGCGSVPKAPEPVASRPAAAGKATGKNLPVLPPAGSGRGGYYKDDGPGDNPPDGLLDIPDAEPKVEPYSRGGNRPYVVFGKTYTPVTSDVPFKQRGIASWYGKKFHGQKTSSGEPYDMYKMTAAHPTLPIPSYARVTNLSNGRQVIVRVNDRGPFHSNRIIDLSYTAALKLGYLGKGSGELEVERLLPEDIARLGQEKQSKPDQPRAAAIPTPVEPAVKESPLGLQDSPVAAAAAIAANTAPAASGFYLQFGAYSQADNAEVMRSQLAQNWASKLSPFEVVPSGNMFRLYSGPYASRTEAANAAQQVQSSGTYKPLIVQR